MIADEKALVLFSGGQDSATCLAWALEKFSAVETVGFDYGQRHRIELECRSELLARIVEINPTWKERLGADHTLDLSVLGQISETGLTRDAEIALREDGLPNTFVPGRNLLFLITEHSHTCYLGERTVRHEWGYGCGTCPACELRARGYESFREGTRS